MRKTLLCLMVLLALPAHAQVAGGSNIGLTQYPAPSCTKPQLPDMPKPTARDNADPNAFNAKVRKYNADVAVYNGAMKTFNDCMHAYIEAGNADMQRIKQTLDAAVAAANAP